MAHVVHRTDGIMITNNSNNYYVFLNVFMFRIMSMTLRNLNPQKEIFHHNDFPVYTTSKYIYRDPKLDTYRRITPKRTRLRQIDIFLKIGKAKKVKRVSKIWVRMSTTNIRLLQCKI